MTGWYDPGQLLNTGRELVVSLLLAKRADFRAIEAIGDGQPLYDYSRGREEVWFDFVADVGDGWNSTYSVAYLLGRSELKLAGHPVPLPRGEFLMMGGDEVYPVATVDAYESRLVAPYASAAVREDRPIRPDDELVCDSPHLFAIPGNHDWYDGLSSFMGLFCQQRAIGNWQTVQRRSYFAVKLPQHWWLIAVDIQLESDIDEKQKRYFLEIAKKMEPGDRIILCTAEPDWVYARIEEKPQLQRTVSFLVDRILEIQNAQVFVRIAGDLHHYRHHQHGSAHAIVAGGGGAFLHPTHGTDVECISIGEKEACEYQLVASYPDVKTSRRLAWRNLLFPWFNTTFGFATAAVYLLLSYVMPDPLPSDSALRVARAALHRLSISPGAVVVTMLVALAFIAFTDTNRRWFKVMGGGAHAALHLAAALGVAWGAMRVSAVVPYTTLPIKLAGGYLVGGLIMGGYLLLSLNVLKRHANEAFSSLKIEDYKSFLRLHIGRDGKLTIYPVKIDRVARSWRERAEPLAKGDARFEPEERIQPALIEQPIEILPDREKQEKRTLIGAAEEKCL